MDLELLLDASGSAQASFHLDLGVGILKTSQLVWVSDAWMRFYLSGCERRQKLDSTQECTGMPLRTYLLWAHRSVNHIINHATTHKKYVLYRFWVARWVDWSIYVDATSTLRKGARVYQGQVGGRSLLLALYWWAEIRDETACVNSIIPKCSKIIIWARLCETPKIQSAFLLSFVNLERKPFYKCDSADDHC